MERTKAGFKAMREGLGLIQQDVADAVGVRALAVNRWERPGWPEPPDDAWAYLEAMAERMGWVADEAVGAALRMRDETGAGRATLTYFRDQSMYDAHGRDRGPFGFANAAARLAAAHLDAEGFEVSFAYPGEGAAPTPGSRY